MFCGTGSRANDVLDSMRLASPGRLSHRLVRVGGTGEQAAAADNAAVEGCRGHAVIQGLIVLNTCRSGQLLARQWSNDCCLTSGAAHTPDH